MPPQLEMPNHFDPSSGTSSATYLTPQIFLDCTWRVHHNSSSSDNFPIIIKGLHPEEVNLPKWRLKKKWKNSQLCLQHLIKKTQYK